MAIRDGSLASRLQEEAQNWELSFKTPDLSAVEGLLEQLDDLGWKTFNRQTESATESLVKYGGAPIELVEHVIDLVAESTGIRLGASKVWGNDDDDIWVYLPRVEGVVETQAAVELDLDSWLLGDESAPEPSCSR